MAMRFLVAAPLLLLAIPAQAQTFETAASATIKSGDYSEAESILQRQLRHRPDRPELLLNLAAVYANTDRPAEARALYRKVLSSDSVEMELRSGAVADSHAIARAGLRTLGSGQTARVD